MTSIAVCKSLTVVAGMTIALLASAHSTNKSPTTVRDPVLGLRYSFANAQLEALPPEVFKVCADLVNENASRQSWIFAKLDTPSGTYYVLGGYYVRRKSIPAGAHRYESDDNGALIRVSGDRCEMIDPADGSFGAGSALPSDILEPLAADLRRRLERGFGSRPSLKQAMRSQKIGTSAFAPPAQ